MFYKSLIINNISTLYVLGCTWYNKSQRDIKVERVNRFPFLRKFQTPGILLKWRERFPHLHFVMAKGLVCNCDVMLFFLFFILQFSGFILSHKWYCYCLCIFALCQYANIGIAGDLIIYPAPLFYVKKFKWILSEKIQIHRCHLPSVQSGTNGSRVKTQVWSSQIRVCIPCHDPKGSSDPDVYIQILNSVLLVIVLCVHYKHFWSLSF